MALLMDSDFGTQEKLHLCVGECPMALKATKMDNPDSPQYAEAMSGPYREKFEEGIRKEINKLQEHGIWVIEDVSAVPLDERGRPPKILPSIPGYSASSVTPMEE
jgi:hypothetical protein